MASHPARVLKLGRHDPTVEDEFEIGFLLSLTTQERFDMVLSRSREVLEMLIRNGHRRPSEIVKRT